MRRGTLKRAKRADLERFAMWLGLRWSPEWSQRHLAGLVFWRITRGKRRWW